MKNIILFILLISFVFPEKTKALSEIFRPIHGEIFSYTNGSFLHRFHGLSVFSYLCKMQYEDSIEGRIQDELTTALWALSSFGSAVGAMGNYLSYQDISKRELHEAKIILTVYSRSWSEAKSAMKKSIGKDIPRSRPELQYIYDEILKINTDRIAIEFCEKYLRDDS